MSRGYSQRGADGITRHYNSNGSMTGFSQRGSDGIYRRYDNNRNVTGFKSEGSWYDNRGNKKKSSWW
uniref:hypothetical protein n=1 Tax=Eubacterium cellulosolvens TaxID=29322 RepID=UPI000481B6B5|nr:hypothetical protein [[Eubacterium] cellulosolvens]